MKLAFPKRRAGLFYISVGLILSTIILIAVLVSRLYMTTISIEAEIAAQPIRDPYQSRFLPSAFYFPRDQEHPKDEEGRPMAILAQINFEEVPRLRGYPRTGILQIFIEAHDDLLGWDEGVFIDHEQRSGYRVRYFPTIDRDPAKLVTDFSFLPNPTDFGLVYLPLHRECTLTFKKRTEFIDPADYRFMRLLGEDFFKKWGPLNDHVWNWFYDRPSRNKHKIGGWGNFAQEDPRHYLDEDWLLLFQMDTDVGAKIFWGDIGIGNFFIRPEDLKNLDFSNVAYDWSS